MPEGRVGIPSAGNIKRSFGDFAYGCIGGAVFGLTTAILGSGFLGLLAAPVVAGSVIKGNRGTAVSTIAGFLALASLFSGSTSTAAATSSRGVM